MSPSIRIGCCGLSKARHAYFTHLNLLETGRPSYREAGLTIPEADRERYGAFRPTEEVHNPWARTLEVARVLAASLPLISMWSTCALSSNMWIGLD